jgi:hypothetical protein
MSTSTNYWTLNANNEPEGPVSLQELRLALDGGSLTQESQRTKASVLLR